MYKRLKLLFLAVLSIIFILAACGDEAGEGVDDLTVTGLQGRAGHTAVWTGAEMIVWGGWTESQDKGRSSVNTGLRYNPSTDTWKTISTANAPTARYGHKAFWTDSEMIVWGGYYNNTGGRYNPSSDTWTAMSTTNAPIDNSSGSEQGARTTAVWTGDKMIVWGEGANVGKLYDPVSNIWSDVSSTNAPSSRIYHTAVWTGTEMIIWGGLTSGPSYTNTGSRYDPNNNIWSAMTTTDADTPSGRLGHLAVWTGAEMIIWGGWDGPSNLINNGGRYNPIDDKWGSTPMSNNNAPTYGTVKGISIWTGTEMIAGGGGDCARYNPVSNTWTRVNVNTINLNSSASAVWTGTEMIVWGGEYKWPGMTDSKVSSGGSRYNPATDTWTRTSIVISK